MNKNTNCEPVAFFKKKGDKKKYDFRDCDCLGRECFAAAMFNHYGTSMSGAKSSTHQSAVCINRAYHGCNLDENPFKKELAVLRKKEGWKCVF